MPTWIWIIDSEGSRLSGDYDFTTAADLSAYAGKTLYAIGIKGESAEDLADYGINLGRLTVLDKTRAALNGPASKALDGTASNGSKWCATNYGSGWMSIDFSLKYKDADGNWVEIKRIQNNTLAVSRTGNIDDITIDELDLTGRIFKLNISQTDTAGWAACVRLYELEMYAYAEVQESELLSASATVVGSGVYVPGEGPELAFDGSTATKWCSETTPN